MSRASMIALCGVLACSSVSDKDLERAATHLQLAQLKLARGDLHYAVREYQAALAISERDAEAHFGLGEALRRLGALDEARHHFERALQIDRDHHENDRRRVIVSLSDAAKPGVAEMRNRHAAPLGRFLGELDDAEAERFIDQLRTLIAHLSDQAN